MLTITKTVKISSLELFNVFFLTTIEVVETQLIDEKCWVSCVTPPPPVQIYRIGCTISIWHQEALWSS